MRVVFLDRDGVINENRSDHVKSWDEFVFIPGALEAIRRLRQAGWCIIVITNQAIINRGIVARATVNDINRRMVKAIVQNGGWVHGVFYCPHRPDENCDCRKPAPGLLLQAAGRLQLPLDKCYLVGDALTDIQAGSAVGCQCALVRTGRGREQLDSADLAAYPPFHITADITTATNWLIHRERVQTRPEMQDSHRPIWKADSRRNGTSG